MPVQVVPPMFRMLEEELQWAIDDVRAEFLIGQERAPLTDFTFAVPDSQKEPYHFSDLLFLSRVFLSSTDSFDEDPNAALQQAIKSSGTVGGGKKSGGGGKKKKKQQHESKSDEEKTWFYHAEDEWIQRVSQNLSHCKWIEGLIVFYLSPVSLPLRSKFSNIRIRRGLRIVVRLNSLELIRGVR